MAHRDFTAYPVGWPKALSTYKMLVRLVVPRGSRLKSAHAVTIGRFETTDEELEENHNKRASQN